MGSRAGFVQGTREHLPEEQKAAMRKAVRWQVFTILYTACTITIVSFVLGGSQAMTTAWVEDMLSLIPQVVFLLALLLIRRRPSRQHPYGWHRAMGIGHLIASVALLAVGLRLAVDAISSLVAADPPTIGEIELFGREVWFGWVMVGVMAVIVIGPFIYGHVKAKLAPILQNKVLYADADMAKADWQTNVASIIGVLGIGIGWWWLDGLAALFISCGIVWDGVRNAGVALQDLMDQQARTVEGEHPHPLASDLLAYVHAQPWVSAAALRLRDQGQVFHVELFVQPRGDEVNLDQIGELASGVAALDWRIHDVVVVPTDPLPEYAFHESDASAPDNASMLPIAPD